MLGTLRKASQSWIAKAFFGLLVLTFVGWGIGPELRMRMSNQPAIKVGDDKIAPETVASEFRREAEQMQRQTGGKLTMDQLREMGFLNQTVQRMVTQALLDQQADRLGLAVDDDTVRKTIANIPAFRNQLDAFDPNLYRQALAANGFSEARFESVERGDIRRAELYDMIGEGTVAPAPLVDPIFNHLYEQRVAELIAFEGSAMPVPPAPEQSVLEAYHKDHATQFTAPERRNVTALVLRAADTVADYNPTDDQINKSYQDQQAEFATNETRHIQQVFFPDKEAAQKLVDAVNGGASFADAAKAAGKEVDDLGTVDRKGVPFDALADAAFASPKTGIAGPVQTPLGFNVVNVVEIKPGSVKPLAEVRDQIVAQLKKTESIARVNALSNKLEDGIGSGQSLEDIAAGIKVAPLKIAGMGADGHGPDGKPIADAPDSQAFRTAAFATAKGALSEAITLENEAGYAVVRVDDVIAPALKPFDSVKDQVLAAWNKDRQFDEAKAAAEAAVPRLNAGEAADKVAGKFKLTVTKGFTRTGNEEVPAPVAAAAFKLNPDQAAAVPVADTAFAIRLASILPADPKTQSEDLDQLRAKVLQSIGTDLDQQYVAALQKEIGVSVRSDLIEAQFSQSQ